MIKNKQPVDFKLKINSHFTPEIIDQELTDATNEYLAFLIKCFNEKNNFYVENFNLNGLIYVKDFYTKLKTNILLKNKLDNYNQLFENIKPESLKCINFIIINYINTKCHPDDKKLYIKMLSLLNM